MGCVLEGEETSAKSPRLEHVQVIARRIMEDESRGSIDEGLLHSKGSGF